MDEVELPPLPPSTRPLATRPTYSLLGRKRSRSAYEPEPATSSDPALFSSDEPTPSAENYSAKRLKDKWRGTWWGEKLQGNETAKEKRQFRRNYDSGIWMGSEGTDSSIDDEFLNDQRSIIALHSCAEDDISTKTRASKSPLPTLSDQAKRVASQEKKPTAANNRLPAESASFIKARLLIQKCVDTGLEDINLSGMNLQTLSANLLHPLRLLTKHSAMQESPASQEVFSSLEAELRIYLANNFLQTLPSMLFDFSNLRVLSLRNNDLVELSPAIGRLMSLETLNVANNKLQYLPFEVLQLIRFGKLHYLVADPNPWRTFQPEEICHHDEGTSSIPISRALPLPAGTIHSVCKVAQSFPEYFNQNGPLRQSSIRPSASTISVVQQMQTSSSVPSLIELTLLKLSKLQDLADLPERLLEDDNMPPSVMNLLGLVRDVQIAGGQCCTSCDRDMVMPRKQWVEWWYTDKHSSRLAPGLVSRVESVNAQLEAYLHDLGTPVSGALPFLRRQCSLSCLEQSQD